MAYETGSATNLGDLVTKLGTFLTGCTAAWTQDQLLNSSPNYYATFHKDDCFVSFRWAGVAANLAVFHQLSYVSGTPGTAAMGDSGNGLTGTGDATTARRVSCLTTGAYTYHFFASDAAPYYCHVVLEIATGKYRHFGFGKLTKFGTWTGGEYCYGGIWSQSVSYAANPTSIYHALGLDGLATTIADCATVRIVGLTGMSMDADSRWGVVATGTPGTDRSGEPRYRLFGGSRSGFWGWAMGWIPATALNAYKPLIPIPVIWRDTAATPDTWLWLGEQPDTAIINMKHINAGDEITVGSDTWAVFPWAVKQYGVGATTEESRNAGIAYKKIV